MPLQRNTCTGCGIWEIWIYILSTQYFSWYQSNRGQGAPTCWLLRLRGVLISRDHLLFCSSPCVCCLVPSKRKGHCYFNRWLGTWSWYHFFLLLSPLPPSKKKATQLYLPVMHFLVLHFSVCPPLPLPQVKPSMGLDQAWASSLPEWWYNNVRWWYDNVRWWYDNVRWWYDSKGRGQCRCVNVSIWLHCECKGGEHRGQWSAKPWNCLHLALVQFFIGTSTILFWP